MQMNTEQLSAQQVNNAQLGYLNLSTFWQINLAVGLSMMTLFIFGFSAPHSLMYQIQHAFSKLADFVGLDSSFFEAMLCLSFVGVFLAIRYSKLAQKLKINRLILCLILAGNIGLLWNIVFHYSPRPIREISYNDVGFFLSYIADNLMRMGFWLAVVSLIATLIWYYVIKPYPKLKFFIDKLLQTQPNESSQLINSKPITSQLGKVIAIAFFAGLVVIGFNQAKKNYLKIEHAKIASTENEDGLAHFNFATWREAIELTQPALDAEKNNDWALAAKEWSTLRSAYPQDFDVLQHRANAYIKLKQYELARIDAFRMTYLSGKNPQGWQTICKISMLTKHSDSEACKVAAFYNQWEAADLLHFAQALHLEGDKKGADEWYQNAIRLISTQEELQTLLDDFEQLKKQWPDHAFLTQAQTDFAQLGKTWLDQLAPANQLLQAAEEAKEQGDYDKAVKFHQQHVNALKKIAGETNGQTMMARKQLALLLSELNRKDEAVNDFADIKKTVENALGKDHPKLVNVLNNYAYVLTNANKNAEAKKMFEESLDLSQNLFGVNSPQTATSLNGLGNTVRKLGDTNLADTALNQSVKVSLSQLLPNYQLVGKRLNNLGLFYYDLGSQNMAEYYFTQALAMTELAVGPNHIDVCQRLHNLGNVMVRAKRYEAAKQVFKRALKIADGANTPNSNIKTTAMLDLASLLKTMGKNDEANMLYGRIKINEHSS